MAEVLLRQTPKCKVCGYLAQRVYGMISIFNARAETHACINPRCSFAGVIRIELPKFDEPKEERLENVKR